MSEPYHFKRGTYEGEAVALSVPDWTQEGQTVNIVHGLDLSTAKRLFEELRLILLEIAVEQPRVTVDELRKVSRNERLR